jgi:hypothetical protein
MSPYIFIFIGIAFLVFIYWIAVSSALKQRKKLFLGFRHREATLADLQQEVGSGWSALLEQLVNDLFALGWNGEVLQCKEKFGGLRFYTGAVTDEMHDVINRAEYKSYTICEECGAPGVARTGGWIKTLCDEHAKGREPHPDL